MKIIILSGGVKPSYKLLIKEINNCDLIICADSGANCLYRYNIIPDYLIGDFDSIDEQILKFFTEKQVIIERYPKEKDSTDTEIAFEKAISLGASEIIFLGCTGGRIDHTLGNLGLLKKCLDLKIDAYLVDDQNIIFINDKPLVISGTAGENFSIQAFGGTVKNLTIKNAKYELSNYDLYFGDPLTVSNEFIGKNVSIEFDNGILLILYCKD
ncbi:MAG: thiamine diphosphokinase [Bacillota bacterium]|nr:thiamine diphosphokinase [Bacillota bacterium]